MKQQFGKSLEQTIKELSQKYKNVPSPLSDKYASNRPGVVPQQKLPTPESPRQNVLGDFRPTPRQW
jgi:hypothetical protein